MVPIGYDRALFALAREPKTFIEVKGRNHIVADVVFDKIVAWLDALP